MPGGDVRWRRWVPITEPRIKIRLDQATHFPIREALAMTAPTMKTLQVSLADFELTAAGPDGTFSGEVWCKLTKQIRTVDGQVIPFAPIRKTIGATGVVGFEVPANDDANVHADDHGFGVTVGWDLTADGAHGSKVSVYNTGSTVLVTSATSDPVLFSSLAPAVPTDALSSYATEATVDGKVSTQHTTDVGIFAPKASPTFTGTVAGVTKAHVGLGSVDNTADADKPVSTAQATALTAKIDTTVANNTFGRGVHVTSTGAARDGVTDDTAAFLAAVTAAAPFGAEVYVPDGVYVVSGLAITSVANITLSPGATLLAKPNMGVNSTMFNFTGTKFRLRGGTIDGNKANQTGRPNIFTGALQTGKTLDVDGVAFVGTVRSVFYISLFGGVASVQNCRFTEQAEHTGVLGEDTTIMKVISGEAAANGLVRFNHNTCIGTDAPALAGANPGGIFLAANGYVAGAPGTAGFADGNLSTLEAIGNYFWGYGQNCGGNDISPIHTYPAIGGARIIGNYFEKCGFCAISAKSVQNFICTGNTVIDGIYSAQNVSSEGAISYVPGYQAASTSRPRAVISGNIIDNPGGTSTTVKQYGIAVHGTTTSYADDVVIADNIINGAGFGIQLDYVIDAVVKGNQITGASGGTAGAEDGIRVTHIYGTLLIDGNHIRVSNGVALRAEVGVNTANVLVLANTVTTSTTSWAVVVRGAQLAKFTGNTIDAPGGNAISVASDGTNNCAKFVWDLSNLIIAGLVSFNFAQITTCAGHIAYGNAPEGLVVAPPGTLYTRTNSVGALQQFYVKETTAAATGWVGK